MSEQQSEGTQGGWTFSVVGLVWLVISGAALLTFKPVLMLVGLAALAYSVYLFRGGAYKFIIW